jgi:t-SNARE complex subunit (syntaxin)
MCSEVISCKGFCDVQLMETLSEINERHEAVKELNKSLLELHQMFLDMAVLVEQQGVQLDNIERQVSPLHCRCATEQL